MVSRVPIRSGENPLPANGPLRSLLGNGRIDFAGVTEPRASARGGNGGVTALAAPRAYLTPLPPIGLPDGVRVCGTKGATRQISNKNAKV
jgi:hypothetical protein